MELVFVIIIFLLLPFLSAEGEAAAASRVSTPYAADMPPGSPGQFFFRLPFLEVLSDFSELPITKSIVVVRQKVTKRAIFRSLFLYGYYVDSSGVCFAVYCTSQCRA